MVLLFFAVVGRALTDEVDVDEGATIASARKLIKETLRLDCPPAELTLYSTKRGEPGQEQWLSSSSPELRTLQKEPMPDDIKNKFLVDTLKLDPFKRVETVFAGAPQEEVIHILEKLPERLAASPSRKRKSEAFEVVDSTSDWKDSFRHTNVSAESLPLVSELSTFIKAALPEKIRVTSTALSTLRQKIRQKRLDELFVQNDDAPCAQLYTSVVSRALDPVSSMAGGTSEAAFIPYWDSLIRVPLQSTARRLRFNRDTSRMASTLQKRPNFVCTLDRVCVFRGEETDSSETIAAPKEELRSRLVWTFGSAPYILGYATSGDECELYALICDSGELVQTVKIASFQTDQAEDRLCLLLAILQLSRLFEGIVRLCPEAARDEFQDIRRPNGVVVRLTGRAVKKEFPLEPRWAHIASHLDNVYHVIDEHSVPHTDKLEKSQVAERKFSFSPRGVEQCPRNLDELFIAIGQVLECLVAFHAAGWMHRDLRWDNVLKRRDVDEPQWFVIDFVDAAPSPKQNSRLETLNPENHAPEIFIEGGSHMTAVDLWGVGFLIDSCHFKGELWDDSGGERNCFRSRLMSEDPTQRPCASEALALLRDLMAARGKRRTSSSKIRAT